MALIEVRLRPTTPWRVGHGGGDRERVDIVYHSDALYSAITHAMKTLGWLEEWLAATARSEGEPAVRFSSLFPFIGRTRLIAPPKTWWPPANPGRLYTEAAKLIPLEVVRNGIVDESRWMVNGETGCLFHTGSGAPATIEVRTAAAVDRLTGVADPHRIACLAFASNAGYWGVFAVSDPQWESRVKSAFRLLADSGFGGERSRGWGRAAAPEFNDASSLLPSAANGEGEWWLLSTYSPHASDTIDWTRGEYTATERGGWTDSQSGIAPKKQVRLLEEGSVLFAPRLRGRAVDVAPEGFAHPVYRAGFALAVPAPPEPVMRQPRQPEPATQELPPELVMEGEGAPPAPPAPPAEIEPPAEPQTETPTASEPSEPATSTLPSRDWQGAVAERPEQGTEPPVQEPTEQPATESEPAAEPQPETPTAPEAIEKPSAEPEGESAPPAEPRPETPTAPASVVPSAEPARESAPPAEPQPETPTAPASVEPSAEPERESEPAAEPQPETPTAPESVEQPSAKPELEPEPTPAPSGPDIEQPTPARPAKPDVETDTQGSSSHEELL
jgi:CRISPR/Cas system CSM-associated protein Csm4 (group 5 of RAMP superfamily)